MNHYLTVVLAIVAVLGCLAVGTSEAEDFTFTVPVALASVHPDASRIDLVCAAYTDSTHSNNIGEGKTTVPLDGSGNYTGNVVVKFNHHPGKDPAAAKRYGCYLQIWVGNTGAGPTANAQHVARRPKEGTTLTPSAHGAIPD